MLGALSALAKAVPTADMASGRGGRRPVEAEELEPEGPEVGFVGPVDAEGSGGLDIQSVWDDRCVERVRA